MKSIYTTFLCCILYTFSYGSGYFEFSPKLTAAYQKAISIQFVDAKKLVEEVKEEEPNNVLVYYVENYIDFLKIYIDEDYDEFLKLESNKEYRLKKLKTGDSSSPYYLYTLAEVRLQWALARVKFEEYRTAMFEVRNAYLKLERNHEKFPDFVANKKSLGILHAVVGTVPPNYKWLAKLAGMDGTIEQGRKEIKEVIDYAATHPSFIFEEEAIVMYSLLVLHIGNDSNEAMKMIQSNRLDPSQNPLICFAQASVAQHTKNINQAIKILENRPRGKQYHPYHFLDFMMGVAKLNRLDSDAGFYLHKFVINFKGRNYIKECYQKIAWFELLNNNKPGYLSNMALAKKKGKAIIDSDKNALKMAQKGTAPHPVLLKVRLLFDGGYFNKALQILDKNPIDNFNQKDEQLEYSYRKGRVLQSLKQYNKAIENYKYTINKGKNSSYYYACRAALEAGIIYENQRNYLLSKTYYNRCLNIYPEQYQNSLHAKAKAGLNRIKR